MVCKELRIISAILIAHLLCASGHAFAQETTPAASLACKSLQAEAHVLEKTYLDCHFPAVSDLIYEIAEGADAQKDDARDLANANYTWDQFVQWTVVILAFLTTVFTALAKSYPTMKFTRYEIELTFLPIIFAALVTLATSIAAYYSFKEKIERDRSVQMDIAVLMTDMVITLRSDVAIGKHLDMPKENNERSSDQQTLRRKTTSEWLSLADEWMSRLEAILGRYRPSQDATAGEE